jgi:uncharacterized protein with PIN domain
LIFIDTSALIAILADEDDAAVYGAAIDDDREPLTSPAVILEASMRLSQGDRGGAGGGETGDGGVNPLGRHAELVSASTIAWPVRAEGWTLKQVQGDGGS